MVTVHVLWYQMFKKKCLNWCSKVVLKPSHTFQTLLTNEKDIVGEDNKYFIKPRSSWKLRSKKTSVIQEREEVDIC